MPTIIGWYTPPEPEKLLYVVDRVHSRQTHWIDLARQSAACFGRYCALCESFPQKLEVIIPVKLPGASVAGLLKLPSALLASDALLRLQAMGRQADGQAIQLMDWYSCPALELLDIPRQHLDSPRCDGYIRAMGVNTYRKFAAAK